MGIKHLVKVEEFLKENKQYCFPKYILRDKLNIDLNTLLSAIDYLVSIKKIIIEKKDGIEYVSYNTTPRIEVHGYIDGLCECKKKGRLYCGFDKKGKSFKLCLECLGQQYNLDLKKGDKSAVFKSV